MIQYRDFIIQREDDNYVAYAISHITGNAYVSSIRSISIEDIKNQINKYWERYAEIKHTITE